MLARHLSAVATAHAGLRLISRREIIVIAAQFILSAVTGTTVAGTNGTWINATTGGLWSIGSNWSSGTIANGTDGIADFSTLNITADDTVHLDSARTIGQLKFGDTVPSNNWFVDNSGNPANILTLAVSSGSPTITVNNDVATISAVLAGTQGLTEAGAGTLVLSGSNTFTGGVTVGGNLQLGSTGALNSTTPNSIAMNAGVLSLGGNSVTIGGLTSTTGGGIVQDANAAGATLTVTNSAVDTFSGTLQDGSGGGKLALVVAGSRNLFLSGNNTFTGGVTINSGALQVGSAGALNANTPNAVTFGPNSTGTLFFGGVPNVTVSGLNSNGGTPIVENDNGVSTTGTLTVNNAVANTFGGVLQDGGPGPLAVAKTGAGILTLSGNNVFTGGVTINAGTLQVGNAGALNFGTPNAVTFGSGSTGALNLNGFSVTISGLNTNSTIGTPIVQNANATAATLMVNNAVDNTYAGDLQDGAGGGPLSLIKTGAGNLTFSGANTFTGPITVSGGTLTLGGGSLAADVHDQATFVYNSGTFNGRLFLAGAATFNAPFTARNGMENDVNLSIPPGQTITLNGLGLDNEGTLTMAGGTLNLSTGGSAANVNRGGFNLPATMPFNLGSATLTNAGTLNLDGGLLDGSGALINNPGGIVTGNGVIQSGFSNSGGTLVVGGGPTNITPAFNNSGLIQLAAANSDLIGGTITNNGAGTIQGTGVVGNSVTNTGTIEPIGGTLSISGTLLNPAGGLIRVGAGNKLLVTQGLLASAGVVNLTGGTFDNGGQPLDNLGQISGYGTFATGGTGLDNNGSITFSGGVTTVNGPVTNENGKTITIAQTPAIFTSLVTNNAGGTFNAVNTTATFAGGFTNNGNSNFVKAGGGTVEIDSAPTLNSGSTLSVTTGTLRFNVVSGTPTIGTGVTAVISAGATLELAGSVSALANGSNRVNIINNSNAPGVLVSGTNQQVGDIDGSGTTQVNSGSDLTANHIIQGALVIGGTSKNPGLVTIDASDASGNPLASPTVSAAPTADILVDGAEPGISLNGDPVVGSPTVLGSITASEPAEVPEPSSLFLAAFGGLALGLAAYRRRSAILIWKDRAPRA